jgi:phage FluMu protein Com
MKSRKLINGVVIMKERKIVMQWRCDACDKLLLIGELLKKEIRCPKCSTANSFKAIKK